MRKPLTPEQAEALYFLAKRIVDKKRRKQLAIYDAIERYEKEHKQ